MFRDAFDPEGLAVATNSQHQLVVLNIELGSFPRRDCRPRPCIWVQVGLESDGLVFEVDIRRPSLMEFIETETTYRLDGGAELERTDGGRSEERGEDEVGARGYEDA